MGCPLGISEQLSEMCAYFRHFFLELQALHAEVIWEAMCLYVGAALKGPTKN